MRGPECEFARHLCAALPPPIGFQLSLLAAGPRFRGGLRPTPVSVRPEGAARSTRRSSLSTSRLVGGRSVARRLLQSFFVRSGARPSNRPNPAGSISSTDAVSCGPVRVGFAARFRSLAARGKAETLLRAPDSVAGLLPSESGAGVAFALASGTRADETLSRLVAETHDYPGPRCSHAPLVAEHVARAQSGAKKPSLTLNGSDGRRCPETRTRTAITRTVAGPRCPRLLTCSPARDACSRRRGRRASCCCFPAKGYISASLEVLSIHETPCGAALSTGCPQPVEEWRSPLFRAWNTIRARRLLVSSFDFLS